MVDLAYTNIIIILLDCAPPELITLWLRLSYRDAVIVRTVSTACKYSFN